MKEILIVAIVVALVCYFDYISRTEVSLVTSTYDNNEYLVLNKRDKHDAAYLLGLINGRITSLISHLKSIKSNHKQYEPYIDQLIVRIDGVVLSENSPGGQYTSYTVNKGDEISLCLRSSSGEIHDSNVVTYVVIHELAHVACPEQGHTELFKDIFVFLLRISSDINIYKPVDYQNNPVTYCGMTITENLL